jgi:predicted nucleotidyltransferase component of viral defense system
MLQKQTTRPELIQILDELMAMPSLSSFRLVGGTALSLLKGHRLSVDIDLFTDAAYGTTDFEAIEADIKIRFPIVENPYDQLPQLKALENNKGLHLAIGYDEENLVKTDILYWEPFLYDAIEIEGVRMATAEEIGAMKLDVIGRGGRKKDFWDLVELFDDYSLEHLMEVYTKKYPYHDIEDVKNGLTLFEHAEEVPDPICLRGRSWEEVKERLRQEAGRL